jgi:AcrR family transcriptional regulator
VGIAERKEREKEELRDRILDAARVILLSEGVEALTMRKVADAIEYSPGTIYLHFAGRDDLVMAICRQAFERLLAAFAPAASITDPYERLFAIGRFYVEFALANPEAYRLMFMVDSKFSNGLMTAGSEEGPDPGDQAYAVLRDTVSELIGSGRFRAVDPDAAAQVLWMGVHGIASLKLNMSGYDRLAPTDELVDLMQDVYVHGMLAER